MRSLVHRVVTLIIRETPHQHRGDICLHPSRLQGKFQKQVNYAAIAVAWTAIICHCSLLPAQEPLIDGC